MGAKTSAVRTAGCWRITTCQENENLPGWELGEKKETPPPLTSKKLPVEPLGNHGKLLLPRGQKKPFHYHFYFRTPLKIPRRVLKCFICLWMMVPFVSWEAQVNFFFLLLSFGWIKQIVNEAGKSNEKVFTRAIRWFICSLEIAPLYQGVEKWID